MGRAICEVGQVSGEVAFSVQGFEGAGGELDPDEALFSQLRQKRYTLGLKIDVEAALRMAIRVGNFIAYTGTPPSDFTSASHAAKVYKTPGF